MVASATPLVMSYVVRIDTVVPSARKGAFSCLHPAAVEPEAVSKAPAVRT